MIIVELWEDPLLFRYICFTYKPITQDEIIMYMQCVGVSIDIIGLGIGPLLGSAVTEICNRVRFNEREHTAS